jgi:DNA-binding NarL/FixJ family response regulator
VLKNAQPEEIVQAVRDVYQGKSVLDASLTRRMVNSLFTQPENEPVEELTERELEILSLAGRGLTNKAIASQLSISDRTVQNHLANIFGKLNATSRTEAVMRGVSLGLIPANLADTPLD